MPAEGLKLRCHHILSLIAVVFLVPAGVEAQTGGVTLKGTVSETVALSVLQNLTQGNVDTNVVSSGNTVRITLSGNKAATPIIRVPLLVRSNSGFRISAAVDSQTAVLTQLSIIDVRTTGTLVSPLIISQLNVPEQFDWRGLDESASSAANPRDVSRPVLVVSGPRVSLGGTLGSPNNALQITVLIHLKTWPDHGSLVHLTFAGTPVSQIQ